MPKRNPYDHWHQILDSTIIHGCGIQDGKLRVSFHNKGKSTGVYQYDTDDKTLCCQMAESGSKGNFFHTEIKHLPATRIG